MPKEQVAVLQERLDNLEEKLLEKLSEIHEQTKKTNGAIAECKKWQYEHDTEKPVIISNYDKIIQRTNYILAIHTAGIVLLFIFIVPKLWSIIRSVPEIL